MTRMMVLAFASFFSVSEAYADIGAVGNPNLPKPAEKPVAAATATAEAAPAETKPAERVALVEINFDRNYVNYEGALNQSVRAAEKAKPGVVYNVVSYTPAPSDSERQNARMNERAEQNLRAVVNSLKQKGVPTTRIRVMMQPGSGNYDTVKLFVE